MADDAFSYFAVNKGIGPACELGFAGYRYDPVIRKYHVRNRVYDPRMGRWLQRDPLGYVDGMSLYAYVGNDPAGAIDPMGLMEEDGAERSRLIRKAREYGVIGKVDAGSSIGDIKKVVSQHEKAVRRYGEASDLTESVTRKPGDAAHNMSMTQHQRQDIAQFNKEFDANAQKVGECAKTAAEIGASALAEPVDWTTVSRLMGPSLARVERARQVCFFGCLEEGYRTDFVAIRPSR